MTQRKMTIPPMIPMKLEILLLHKVLRTQHKVIVEKTS